MAMKPSLAPLKALSVRGEIVFRNLQSVPWGCGAKRLAFCIGVVNSGGSENGVLAGWDPSKELVICG